MLHTITPAQMRALEQRVFSETDETALSLMERAAGAICRAALAYGGKAVILCGPGNNGADGLAAARLILAGGGEAVVYRVSGRETDEWRAQAALLGAPVLPFSPEQPTPSGACCAVDALFGTGLSRALSGEAAQAARWLNRCGLPVISCDIPSGLDGETGAALGTAVFATETVTFHRPKPGLYLKDGLDHSGAVRVCDIGIPPELDDVAGFAVLTADEVPYLLPARRHLTHKGSFGRVLLLVGSEGMAGAAALCALSALKSGAGLVSVACPREVMAAVQAVCPCATCVPLDEDDAPLLHALEAAQVVGVGCGLGQSEAARRRVSLTLSHLRRTDKPAVLDADALNLLSRGELPRLSPHQVVTPHPAEAARLLGCAVADVLADAPAAAARLEALLGCGVVLKGACTVLRHGGSAALNIVGTPALAKGGSGDVLTGCLCARLADSESPLSMLERMQLGCAMHGLAARRAASLDGEYGLLATGVCRALGWLTRPERHALGRRVTVTVDRPLGSRHPRHPEMVYPINYGYVVGVLADDGAWQDAYLLGVSRPVERAEGVVVGVIHRLDDIEDKWLVAPEGTRLTKREMLDAVSFQEQYFAVKLETDVP